LVSQICTVQSCTQKARLNKPDVPMHSPHFTVLVSLHTTSLLWYIATEMWIRAVRILAELWKHSGCGQISRILCSPLF